MLSARLLGKRKAYFRIFLVFPCFSIYFTIFYYFVCLKLTEMNYSLATHRAISVTFWGATTFVKNVFTNNMLMDESEREFSWLHLCFLVEWKMCRLDVRNLRPICLVQKWMSLYPLFSFYYKFQHTSFITNLEGNWFKSPAIFGVNKT